MFGLNLWARPFLPGAPGGMGGMDAPGGLPRSHPALGLGTAPTYLLPGLSADKAAAAAASSAAMHSPFAPGSLFMYRPESMLHPHMLRVNVDHGLHLNASGPATGVSSASSGPGADPGGLPHSLRDHHGGSDSGSVESYPSAFQPTKRVRLTDGVDGGHPRTPSRHSDGGHKGEEAPAGYYGGDRGEDGGRGGGSSSRPSPGSMSSVRSPDSARASPHDARQAGGLSPARSEPRTPGGPPRCPVCGVGLAPGEVDAHYTMELDRLRVLARMERGENAAEGADEQRSSVTSSSTTPTSGGANPSSSPSVSSGGAMSVSESRYETYLKIRNNRHVRLCAKTRARRKRPSDTPPHDGEDPSDHFVPGGQHHPALHHLHPHHHPGHHPGHHPHHPHPGPQGGPPHQPGMEHDQHHLQSAAVTSLANTHRALMGEPLSSHLPSSAYQSPIYQSAPHHSPPNYPPNTQRSPNYPPNTQRSPNYPPSAQQSPHYAQGGHRSPNYPPRSPQHPSTGHRSPHAYPPQSSSQVAARQSSPTAPAAVPAREGSSSRAQSPVGSSPPPPGSNGAGRQVVESDDEEEFIRVDSPRPESVIVNVCSVDTPTPRPASPPETTSDRGTTSPHLTIPAAHLARQPVSIKCQVCQGAYSRPVTSVTCWHVHCEDCWIKAMGNKRVCPQCKSVTAQADLRKVYI